MVLNGAKHLIYVSGKVYVCSQFSLFLSVVVATQLMHQSRGNIESNSIKKINTVVANVIDAHKISEHF